MVGKNGTAIAGATSAVYNTPVVVNADNGSSFSVTIINSAGSITSNAAALTVAAAAAPSIVAQPTGASVSAAQTVTFAVVASGSSPLHYQWRLNGTAVGDDASTYIIASAQDSDAGTYTVTVSNPGGSVTSDAVILSVSGSNGPNLAAGKTAFESSEQNAGLTAKFAFDGDPTTRWASATGVDPSSISVDLGSVRSIDRVVLKWENAYAKAYLIQVSNDNQNWATVFTQAAGRGATETLDFPSTDARYVRMYGTQRATPYGYSLFEFQVFSVPQCGGRNERYTVQPAASGTYVSTIDGLPSGPFVPTVVDNMTKLTWQQYATTFAQQGAQFTQPVAASYCTSIGMRLPTQAEALSVAAGNYASCAFPNPWTTWTSTPVPNESGRAYFVSSAGVSSSQIIVNSPGWALCVSGTAATPLQASRASAK